MAAWCNALASSSGADGSGEPDGVLDKPLHDYPPASTVGSIFSHYGIDSAHHNALSWIDDWTVLMWAGKFVHVLNLRTGAVESLPSPDEDGAVGVVAVHPSRTCFVVGERTLSEPRLRVYRWPQRQWQHDLTGGASVGFAACAFDAQGARMASVATSPDYTLAVWDWHARTLLLRTRCFVADVYRVQFSLFDNSQLVSCGVGHIKFWTMAQTFTGLKLQGTLGKFDRVEMSSIAGVVVLPDGKVVSGSESGNLLLWEGDTIACVFVGAILPNEGHTAHTRSSSSSSSNSSSSSIISNPRSRNGLGSGADQRVACHSRRDDAKGPRNVDEGEQPFSSPRGNPTDWKGHTNETNFRRHTPHHVMRSTHTSPRRPPDDSPHPPTGGAPSRVGMPPHQPCHKGAIHVVTLLHDARVVVSAGEDGILRYWDRAELEVADGGGLPPLYAPACLLAHAVPSTSSSAAPMPIQSMTLCESSMRWAVMSTGGEVGTVPCASWEALKRAKDAVHSGRLALRAASALSVRDVRRARDLVAAPSLDEDVDEDEDEPPAEEDCVTSDGRHLSGTSAVDEPATSPCRHTPRLHFNGGGVRAAVVSRSDYTVITGGGDGVVRWIDFVQCRELCRMEAMLERGNGGGGRGGAKETSLPATPPALRSPAVCVLQWVEESMVMAGFDNGVIRLIRLHAPADTAAASTGHVLRLCGQWRPHRCGLVAIAVSTAQPPRGLCTVAEDGTLFFFDLTRGSTIHTNSHTNNTFNPNEDHTCTTTTNNRRNACEGVMNDTDTDAAAALQLQPRGMCRAPVAQPRCAVWDEDVIDGGCLVGFEDGTILALAAPRATTTAAAAEKEEKEKETTPSVHPHGSTDAEDEEHPTVRDTSGEEGGGVGRLAEPDSARANDSALPECAYALLGLRPRRRPPARSPEAEWRWRQRQQQQQHQQQQQQLLRGPSTADPNPSWEAGLLVSAAAPMDESSGPWPVVLMARLPGGDLAIGFAHSELVYRYRGSVRYANTLTLPPLPPTGVEPVNYVEEPGENLCYRDCVPLGGFVTMPPAGGDAEGGALLVICPHAQLLLRTGDSPVRLIARAHDPTAAGGRVISAAFLSFDGAFVVTTGREDGLVVAVAVRRVDRAPPPRWRPPMTTGRRIVSMSTHDAAPHDTRSTKDDDNDEEEEEEEESLALRSSGRVCGGRADRLHDGNSHHHHHSYTDGDERYAPVRSMMEQQAAENAARAAAARAARHQAIVHRLQSVRTGYAAIVARNAALPPPLRLGADALRLDATLRDRLAAERERRVSLARRALVVQTARADAATAKLRRRFLDPLLQDGFVVCGFDESIRVGAFRVVCPDTAQAAWARQLAALAASEEKNDDDDEEEEENEDEEDNDDKEAPPRRPRSSDRAPSAAGDSPRRPPRWGAVVEHSMRDVAESAEAYAPAEETAGRPGGRAAALGMSASTHAHLVKLDARRAERAARARGYRAVLAQEPNPREEEAALAAEVQQARRERGDCVLRIAAAAATHRPTTHTCTMTHRRPHHDGDTATFNIHHDKHHNSTNTMNAYHVSDTNDNTKNNDNQDDTNYNKNNSSYNDNNNSHAHKNTNKNNIHNHHGTANDTIGNVNFHDNDHVNRINNNNNNNNINDTSTQNKPSEPQHDCSPCTSRNHVNRESHAGPTLPADAPTPGDRFARSPEACMRDREEAEGAATGPTAADTLRTMMYLLHHMVDLQMQFNAKVVQLKEDKTRVLAQLRRCGTVMDDAEAALHAITGGDASHMDDSSPRPHGNHHTHTTNHGNDSHTHTLHAGRGHHGQPVRRRGGSVQSGARERCRAALSSCAAAAAAAAAADTVPLSSRLESVDGATLRAHAAAAAAAAARAHEAERAQRGFGADLARPPTAGQIPVALGGPDDGAQGRQHSGAARMSLISWQLSLATPDESLRGGGEPAVCSDTPSSPHPHSRPNRRHSVGAALASLSTHTLPRRLSRRASKPLLLLLHRARLDAECRARLLATPRRVAVWDGEERGRLAAALRARWRQQQCTAAAVMRRWDAAVRHAAVEQSRVARQVSQLRGALLWHRRRLETLLRLRAREEALLRARREQRRAERLPVLARQEAEAEWAAAAAMHAAAVQSARQNRREAESWIGRVCAREAAGYAWRVFLRPPPPRRGVASDDEVTSEESETSEAEAAEGEEEEEEAWERWDVPRPAAAAEEEEGLDSLCRGRSQTNRRKDNQDNHGNKDMDTDGGVGDRETHPHRRRRDSVRRAGLRAGAVETGAGVANRRDSVRLGDGLVGRLVHRHSDRLAATQRRSQCGRARPGSRPKNSSTTSGNQNNHTHHSINNNNNNNNSSSSSSIGNSKDNNNNHCNSNTSGHNNSTHPWARREAGERVVWSTAWGEEACPAGCTAENWDTLRQMRQRRRELANAATEALEQARRARRAGHTARVTLRLLARRREELCGMQAALRQERRSEVNRLGCVLSLRHSQIRCATDVRASMLVPPFTAKVCQVACAEVPVAHREGDERSQCPRATESQHHTDDNGTTNNKKDNTPSSLPSSHAVVSLVQPSSPTLRGNGIVILREATLHALRQRVYALAHEKAAQGQYAQDDRELLRRCRLARAEARSQHDAAAARVRAAMLLKFGQHVPLSDLEECGTSWRVEERRAVLRQVECDHARAVRERQNRIAHLRDTLAMTLRENTTLLQDYGDAAAAQHRLNGVGLRALSKVGTRTQDVATRKSRNELRALVRAQREEMAALLAEVAMLKRKGGHVYLSGNATY